MVPLRYDRKSLRGYGSASSVVRESTVTAIDGSPHACGVGKVLPSGIGAVYARRSSAHVAGYIVYVNNVVWSSRDKRLHG